MILRQPLSHSSKARVIRVAHYNMLKDHNHDLVHALSEKNDALWRYKNHYLKAAAGCNQCLSLWKKLEEDDSQHVKMLTAEIKRHLDEGRFD